MRAGQDKKQEKDGSKERWSKVEGWRLVKGAEKWNVKVYWWCWWGGGVTSIEQDTSIRNKSCLCGGGKRAGGDK